MRHAMCQWIALSACVCLLSLGGAHNARAASAAQIRYVAPAALVAVPRRATAVRRRRPMPPRLAT
jgi:hypothetical protein